MGNKKGYSFDRVYQSYLVWFRQKALKSARPSGPEDILKYQLCHEDVFEQDGLLLNRMYFLIPLLPSESKSGHLETFTIAELNLLQKSDPSSCGEFDRLTPIEYTICT